MNHINGVCFILVLFFVCSFALSCLKVCDTKDCAQLSPGACPLGNTKDSCECCPVCFKITGEMCGGPWLMFGKCGKGLTCVKPPSLKGKYDWLHEFETEGTCLPLPGYKKEP